MYGCRIGDSVSYVVAWQSPRRGTTLRLDVCVISSGQILSTTHHAMPAT